MALYDRILSLCEGSGEPGDFEEIALAAYDHHRNHSPAYRRLTEGASEPRRWQDIPCIGTDTFKSTRVASHPPAETRKVFRSSGTSLGRPGEHHMSARQLRLYEASLWTSFRKAFGIDGTAATPELAILARPPWMSPDSSLVHMFECIRQQLAAARDSYWVTSSGELTFEPLPSLRRGTLILATAYALARLTEETDPVSLPEGTAVMMTGGFKGMRSDLDQSELIGNLSRHLTIPEWQVVDQYGMSEMGSQYYDRCLLERDSSSRLKHPLPWCRARVVNAAGRDVQVGERGLLLHYDLSNLDSCPFLASGDVAISHPGGSFQLLGRASQASPQGCSLRAEAEFDSRGPR